MTDESERCPSDLDDQLLDLHELLETMPDGIALRDEHGVIRDVNGLLATLTGFEPGNLIGQDVSILVPFRERSSFSGGRDDYLSEVGVREIGADGDLWMLCHDGRELAVDVRLSPSINSRGRDLFGLDLKV